MATGFAAASHVAAGGHLPPMMLVVLSLALSGPVCMALAGRVLSRSMLLAGVLASQAVFHLLFAVAGSVTTVVDATHHATAVSPPTGPDLVLQAQAHLVRGDTGMLICHVVAAAVTYGFLRHGEVAVIGLLEALELCVHRLWRVLSAPAVAHRPRPLPQGRPHALTDQSLLRPVRSHRGPPAASRRSLLPPDGFTGLSAG